MIISRIRPARIAVAVAVALALCGPAQAADKKLEARVRQLEAMLQTMMAEQEKLKAELEIQKAVTTKSQAQNDQVKARIADVEKAAAASAAPIVKTNPGAVGATKFSFGGYAKADFMVSRFSDAEVAGNNSLRDYYVPGAIPVSASPESYRAFDSHAKDTRFNFGTDTLFANGNSLSTFLEIDFMNDFTGDERVTNAYAPHMRHAYVKYGTKTDNWLVGQTWSNFQDVAALPETVTFLAPAEGAVFVRQPQVRYTSGAFSVSAENPETTINPFGTTGRVSADDDRVPDLTARFTQKYDWGHFTVAALARQLRYDNNGASDSASSYGISIAGKFLFGEDDLRFMLTTGKGIGRYLGINTLNDAVYDSAAIDAGLETIDETGGFIAYRHVWAPGWRSTLMYSGLYGDNNTDDTGLEVTRNVDSWLANLIYSPVPQFDLGVEYAHATRELENGLEGSMDRLQFMAKYSF